MPRVSLALALAAATGCTTYDQFTPQDVPGLEAVAGVTAGGLHTCAVLDNGNRACWGDDSEGQLGVELAEGSGHSTVPVFVPLELDATQMSAGGLHTCAILEDGGVVCWGDNREDQLGFSSCEPDAFTCPAEPQRVPGIAGVVSIAAGGPRDTISPPEPAGFTCAAKSDGTAWCWGGALDAGPTPIQVFDDGGFPLRDIAQVTAGETSACGLSSSGELWCWDSVDRARRVEDLPPIASASVGGRHTCVATAGGEVVCWGSNLNGESGGDDSGVACSSEDTECTVGPTVVTQVSDARAVSAGQRHSCAIDRKGQVTCWGSNQNGQLGAEVGGLEVPPVKVAVAGPAVAIDAGTAHTCALLAGGALQCWGSDSAGQLGVGR